MSKDTQIYSPEKGVKFMVRNGTSDLKSIKEVFEQSGYKRKRPFVFTVEKGESWIDLGANIGAFTVWALEKGAKKVHLFEPDPENLTFLKTNLARYSDERYELIEKAAVADDREKAVFYQNTANGNVWRNGLEKSWQGGEKTVVECTNFRSFLENQNKPLNIKMDIEGTEMAILEDLLKTPEVFTGIKKLVFEWSFDVDDDMKRFRNVLDEMSKIYKHVAPSKRYEETDKWKDNWFPMCTTIYCKN